MSKIKEGMKNKGLRNAKWDKAEKCGNESKKYAPESQSEGKDGKKMPKSGHKVPGRDE